jgi:plasmid stabilization system protein ParE
VAAFQFSRRAEADLLEIGSYTVQTWGVDQAIRYIDQLEECCQGLANNAASGRRATSAIQLNDNEVGVWGCILLIPKTPTDHLNRWFFF